MLEFPKTAKGKARLATEEEIAREDAEYFLASDEDLILCTDSGDLILHNAGLFGYTSPYLHRRIDDDPTFEPGVDYPWIYLDPEGNPYKQTITLGVWDGINSYRTTDTHTHDEDSETCEIP